MFKLIYEAFEDIWIALKAGARVICNITLFPVFMYFIGLMVGHYVL